jgi:hypothetical protein
MEQFIIIETWNGEGYSDSTAQVVRYVLDDFKGFKDTQQYCMSEVKQLVGNSTPSKITYLPKENFISYDIKEDSGCYAWVEFSGQYGVVIHPMTNSFKILENYSDYQLYVKMLLEDSAEYDEEEVDALETEQTDNICFQGVIEGDVILVKF